MIALVKNKMQEIQHVCKKHHVLSLYLIGSATKEDKFIASSDIDFLYRFKKEEINEMDYADNYFSLLFTLQDLLNRKVDLVAEDKMHNPYFIDSINKAKQIVYES
jgi:predicted nucleotidyltransferase